jgi:dihydroxyacid dehydratase/phosphogluconate dehydratase
MVRVSDGRMSGTSLGAAVLHVAPEAAAGGPLSAVRNGDPIVLNVDAERLDLDIPPEDVRPGFRAQPASTPKYRRGDGALYLNHVMQANHGCDLEFLRKRPGESFETEPFGRSAGAIGGW